MSGVVRLTVSEHQKVEMKNKPRNAVDRGVDGEYNRGKIR